jgi:hypothetical protein
MQLQIELLSPLSEITSQRKDNVVVILSASEESLIFCRLRREIVRLSPQDDSARQTQETKEHFPLWVDGGEG